MVVFPNCKINIGLDVLRKRSDGFHELSTLMYPVRGLCDSLEVVRSEDQNIEFVSSGMAVDCPAQSNICVKAFKLMQGEFGISGVRMHLHKVVPFGAGLGGGSADAAFTIRALNKLFGLGLTDDKMEELASKLGSDTAFFIRGRAALASGRGEVLTPFDVDLSGMNLVILKPSHGVSTAQAYAGVTPKQPSTPLEIRLAESVSTWKTSIKNDFEEHILRIYPQLEELKNLLYDRGALYVSMSGSGSAIYGIFEIKPDLKDLPLDLFVYQEVIA